MTTKKQLQKMMLNTSIEELYEELEFHSDCHEMEEEFEEEPMLTLEDIQKMEMNK